jgi:hypothetical protein
VLCFAVLFGTMQTSAVAQSQPSKYVALLAAYPNGGSGLVAAIAEAALANPAEAQAIIDALANATPEQQFSAAAGLRRAYTIATQNGNSEMASAIETAVSTATGNITAAYEGGNSSNSTVLADSRVSISSSQRSSTSTSGTPVSPSKP